ncbi:MAG: hypothetical protein HC905_27350 [Bacteroidales bacterium]|nr:hypothetical protein [Bacteroidales bacterium]
MQEITKTIPQINAPQFREYVREAWKNSGRDINTGDPIQVIDSIAYGKDFLLAESFISKSSYE